MGVMLDFLREFISIRRESKSYCKSCETYKEQLAIANHEKKVLLDQILYKPEPAQAPIVEQPKPIIPNIIPWKVQRAMLEQEDRALAASMRRIEEEKKKAESIKSDIPIENSSISIDQLEKELAIGEEK